MSRLDALTALAKVGKFRNAETSPAGVITLVFVSKLSLVYYETLGAALKDTGYQVMEFTRKGENYVCKIAPVKGGN